jgi:hypothetical protein
MCSANKKYWNNAKRNQGIELMMVRSDHLTAYVLRQDNAKTVQYGDPSSGFEPTHVQPESSAHVAANQDTICTKCGEHAAGRSLVGSSKRAIEDFT